MQFILDSWNKIKNIGINSSMSFKQKQRTLMINLLAISCVPCMAYFAIANYIGGNNILVIINSVNSLACLLSVVLLYHQKHNLAKATLLIPSFICFSLGALLFHNSGQYCLISILIISMLIYDDYRVHILSSIFVACAIVATEFFAPLSTLTPAVPKSRIVFNIVSSISFILIAINFYIQILHRKMQMIEEQRLRLEIANQEKEKIFSIIVHDIKSPFATLESLANALNDQVLNNEDSKEFTEQICEKIASQNKILDDLLKWGSANIKGAAKASSSIFIKDFIDEIAAIYLDQTTSKQIKINIDIPASIKLYANYDHLTVILRNLINNAIKFSYIDGEINIYTTVDETKTYIHIQDNGIGINQVKQSLLFNEIQHSSAGTLNETGSGLGLLLCRDLIQQNHGTISIESDPEKGSTFIIGLPTNEPNTIITETNTAKKRTPVLQNI